MRFLSTFPQLGIQVLSSLQKYLLLCIWYFSLKSCLNAGNSLESAWRARSTEWSYCYGWNAPLGSCVWTLGPHLLALFWEVEESSEVWSGVARKSAMTTNDSALDTIQSLMSPEALAATAQNASPAILPPINVLPQCDCQKESSMFAPVSTSALLVWVSPFPEAQG